MPAHTQPTRRYLLWLAGIGAVVLAYAIFRIVFPAPPQPMSTEATIPVAVIPHLPAPEAADYTAAQTAFGYLISYTDTGFSPASLRIKTGETVRFVNNSSDVLMLSIGTAAPAPLARGAYVQYRADAETTYSDGTVTGSLITS